MAAKIHEMAVVHPSATLADDVVVGPFSVVGEDVTLESGVVLHSHVVVDGNTTIGEGTEIFAFASIGTTPQDLKYGGEKASLTVGKRNVIREHVTMNIGTEGGGMLTKTGDECLFMVGAHVAHDCQIGNNVILVNNATLAGHVEVGDCAIVGGLSAVHQFVRIGAYAMIGGMSGVAEDVPPYATVAGERAYLAGLNLIGLKRRGVNREAIHALRAVYRTVFDSKEGTLANRAAAALAEYSNIEQVQEMLSFVNEDSSRSICMPR